ncbi:MAG TPA: hypothetical protein VEX15_10650 [Nocardioidaceae bacterium]|nr:hypothetical protein [Nocardioidaceae bacterium]
MAKREIVRYKFLPREPAFTPLEALTLAAERAKKGVRSCSHHDKIEGMCAHIAGCTYGFATCGADDAISLWHALPDKFRRHGIERMRKAPAGALLFWSGGSEGHGHAGIADGRGNILGTDRPTMGEFGRADIDRIEADFGLTPKGWSFPFFELAASDNRRPPEVRGHRRPETGNVDRFIASQHDAIAAAKRAIVARPSAEADRVLRKLIRQSGDQITLARTLRHG